MSRSFGLVLVNRDGHTVIHILLLYFLQDAVIVEFQHGDVPFRFFGLKESDAFLNGADVKPVFAVKDGF